MSKELVENNNLNPYDPEIATEELMNKVIDLIKNAATVVSVGGAVEKAKELFKKAYDSMEGKAIIFSKTQYEEINKECSEFKKIINNKDYKLTPHDNGYFLGQAWELQATLALRFGNWKGFKKYIKKLSDPSGILDIKYNDALYIKLKIYSNEYYPHVVATKNPTKESEAIKYKLAQTAAKSVYQEILKLQDLLIYEKIVYKKEIEEQGNELTRIINECPNTIKEFLDKKATVDGLLKLNEIRAQNLLKGVKHKIAQRYKELDIPEDMQKIDDLYSTVMLRKAKYSTVPGYSAADFCKDFALTIEKITLDKDLLVGNEVFNEKKALQWWTILVNLLRDDPHCSNLQLAEAQANMQRLGEIINKKEAAEKEEALKQLNAKLQEKEAVLQQKEAELQELEEKKREITERGELRAKRSEEDKHVLESPSATESNTANTEESPELRPYKALAVNLAAMQEQSSAPTKPMVSPRKVFPLKDAQPKENSFGPIMGEVQQTVANLTQEGKLSFKKLVSILENYSLGSDKKQAENYVGEIFLALRSLHDKVKDAGSNTNLHLLEAASLIANTTIATSQLETLQKVYGYGPNFTNHYCNEMNALMEQIDQIPGLLGDTLLP